MTSVGISGAPGRMGRLTIDAIDQAEGLEVGGLYAPGHDGDELAGYLCSGDPSALHECDVIIEFTNPDACERNVASWRDAGADVVIGTSGFTTDRIGRLRESWRGVNSRCFVVPNFAVGAVLMMRFAELAAPHFESGEIIEMHHEDKPDAPSGTSLQTAARMAAARSHEPRGGGVELVEGARGAEVEGIAVHSLRVAGAVAHQEVVLGSVGQYLTIRHDTTDYQAFTPGIVLALREISTLPTGITIGLETLLGV